jgi:hypothetical protein
MELLSSSFLQISLNEKTLGKIKAAEINSFKPYHLRNIQKSLYVTID